MKKIIKNCLVVLILLISIVLALNGNEIIAANLDVGPGIGNINITGNMGGTRPGPGGTILNPDILQQKPAPDPCDYHRHGQLWENGVIQDKIEEVEKYYEMNPAENGAGKQATKTIPGLAHKNYDDIKKLKFTSSDISAIVNDVTIEHLKYDEDKTADYYISGYMPNVVCIHTSANDESNVDELSCIINIDEDGTGTIETADGIIEMTDEMQSQNKYLACLAYNLQYNEEVLYFGDYSDEKSSGIYNGAGLFRMVWNIKGYRKYINKIAKIEFPEDIKDIGNSTIENLKLLCGGEDGILSRIDKACNDYVESDNNIYKARIFLFKGGSSQARAVLFGREGNSTKKDDVEIKKYVDEVKRSGSGEGKDVLEVIEEKEEKFSGKRRIFSETYKLENPVRVMTEGTEVTYKIELSNTKTIPVSGFFYDTFDSNYLNFISCELERDGKITKYGSYEDIKYKAENSLSFLLEPGEKIIFTLKLKVINTWNDGLKIPNRATFEKYSLDENDNWKFDKKYISSDYIEMRRPKGDGGGEPGNGEYEKYITKVTHSDGSETLYSENNSRAGLENDAKLKDPVEVEQGDKVTYHIKFKYLGRDKDESEDSETDEEESDLHMCSVNIEDIMDSGLQLSNKGGTTYSYSKTEANGEIDEIELDLEVQVTASNMALQSLKNTVTVSGKEGYTYTEEEWCDNFEEYHEETYIFHNYREIEFKSTKNEDYVRLKDPEIAGTVWFDYDQDGIKDMGNSEDISSIPENHRENITVELWKKEENGQDRMLATTSINQETGKFSFGRVRKGTSIEVKEGTDKSKLEAYVNIGDNNHFYYKEDAKFNQYYLVYNYFGERYEATINSNYNNLDKDNSKMNENFPYDSNAGEIERQEFNNSLETIAYNKAYQGTSGSGDMSKDLEYEKSGHTSELLWDNKGNTTMSAKSVDLYHTTKVGPDGTDTEYLKHINLGLVIRDEADLKISKDVSEAKVSVNGFETTYTYNEQDLKTNYKTDQNYKLRIYKEDYEYRSSKFTDSVSNYAGKDLEIELTYKITVTNESDSKYAKVREIIDISSDEMELVSTSSDEFEVGNIPLNGINTRDISLNEINIPSVEYSEISNYNNSANYKFQGHNVHFLTGMDSETLAPGKSLSIYVTYRVKKNGEAIIKDSSNGDNGKENIVQIGAFSIYSDEEATIPAGLVDIDSNPGNINTSTVNDVTNDSIYEDDTFYTTIKVLVRGDDGDDGDDGEDDPEDGDSNRKITGNVWEDTDTYYSYNNIRLDSTGQRIGDGKRGMSYAEFGAENIVVKLMEVINDNNGNEYLVDTGISTKTNSNGDYTLESKDRLHAGTYVVRFIYGDNASDLKTEDGNKIKYSGQDYKSTTYTPIGNSELEDEVVEATAFKETKQANNGSIVSTAKDNELRRLEVISYSPTMTYELDNILKSTETTGDLEALAENTGMYADTKKFNIQIEYYDDYDIKQTFEYDGKKYHKYEITDVNFGIIERPRTRLQLMNDISEIIAKTSDGRELVHLYFDIDYTRDAWSSTVKHTSKLNTDKSTGYENVQILNRTNNAQGYRYVNIDSGLLQGMTVTIKFQIAVSNNSDIDTSNQNLINMVKESQIANVATFLRGKTTFGERRTVYKYDGGDNEVSKNMLSSYSYKELKDAIKDMKVSPEYGKYRTYINNTQSNNDYRTGYFLGNTYFATSYTKDGTVDTTNDKVVETRVDQIVDYVDNDLVFRLEDNLNENQVIKFMTYTIPEIANKALLKGVNSNTNISDGKANYITDTRNNLAFNVEDINVNSGLYKYLPARRVENRYELNKTDLYVINLEASRTLSSESDIGGMAIDNLAEIIKFSNTVGRKVYVSSSNTTGYIGNSTDVVSKVQDPDSDIDVMKASLESDTDFTEYTTFSPPTGLSKSEIARGKVVNGAIIAIIAGSIITGCSFIIIKFVDKKKFYR